MATSIQDVREYLADISVKRVSDQSVQKQIDVATTKVTTVASASASADLKEKTILAYSGYLTYMAYVTEYERSIGVVPGFMVGHLQELKAIAEQLLGYCISPSTGGTGSGTGLTSSTQMANAEGTVQQPSSLDSQEYGEYYY